MSDCNSQALHAHTHTPTHIHTHTHTLTHSHTHTLRHTHSHTHTHIPSISLMKALGNHPNDPSQEPSHHPPSTIDLSHLDHISIVELQLKNKERMQEKTYIAVNGFNTPNSTHSRQMSSLQVMQVHCIKIHPRKIPEWNHAAEPMIDIPRVFWLKWKLKRPNGPAQKTIPIVSQIRASLYWNKSPNGLLLLRHSFKTVWKASMVLLSRYRL